MLPQRFTFPFYYDPHPLCELAVKQLQNHLSNQQQWQHNFGLDGEKKNAIGKMFGVLLVQNKHNELGYLAAFSGKLAEKNHLPHFVPPVYDLLDNEGFFVRGETPINEINWQIEALELNPEILELETMLNKQRELSLVSIRENQEKIIVARIIRKAKRASAEKKLNNDEFLLLKQQLGQESIHQKKQLKELKNYWKHQIHIAEKNLKQLTDEICLLKIQRKNISSALQKRIFEEYRFLNIYGVEKSLYELFKNTAQGIPPAGAGECAAPKLLQYAFKQHMKPLAMAEFWWGAPHKAEIRKHKKFYSACHGKCKPILEHMLDGMEVDENPLLMNQAHGKSIKVLYEDDYLLVINKPVDLLSVPGTNIKDSVYQRIKYDYPKASGPLIVHRLDMSTSGIMLIALSKQIHKELQKQFIRRTIKKRYIALLDGLIKEQQGIIELPVRVDLDDRPRQLVCYEHGKASKTQWEVIERTKNVQTKKVQTKVCFYPITGRTHQLRIHAAHTDGLNTPILGDDLYGDKSDRLYLHAQYIEFNHPISKQRMHFQVEAEF